MKTPPNVAEGYETDGSQDVGITQLTGGKLPLL